MKNAKESENNVLHPTLTAPQKIVYLAGNPVDYRFRAKEGKITCELVGEKTVCDFKKGDTFTVRPIAVRLFKFTGLYGIERRNEKGEVMPDDWGELFFLNNSGHVCVLTFGRFSVTNLVSNVGKMLHYTGQKMTGVNLEISGKQKSNKFGEYWILQFAMSETAPDASFDSLVLPCIYREYTTMSDDETYNEGWLTGEINPQIEGGEIDEKDIAF